MTIEQFNRLHEIETRIAELRAEVTQEVTSLSKAVTSESNQALKAAIRCALADYMRSEGCGCCRDHDAHKQSAKRLALLLDVPPYDDGSGYEFSRFQSPRKTKGVSS